METIDCPFCDIDAPVEFVGEGWNARVCPSCGLLYISPRPSPSEIADIYKEDEAHGSAMMHLSHFGSSSTRLGAQKSLRLIRNHKPAGRILEIGPGAGTFLVAAKEAGYDVAAVELNPTQADHIRRSLGVECFESLDEVSGTFDVVYHCDVLSHFVDPVAASRRIADLLEPDGLHVFETGDSQIDPRYRSLIKNWQFPDHLFIFSDQSLRRLLADSGFSLLERREYSIAPLCRVMNAGEPLRRALTARRDPSTVDDVPEASKRSPGLSHKAVSAGQEVVGYPFHAIRYGVGRVAPKTGRPKTVLVVARKN